MKLTFKKKMDQLPNEIIAEMFYNNFQPFYIGRFARVCKRWQLIAFGESLWQKICQRNSKAKKSENVSWRREYIIRHWLCWDQFLSHPNAKFDGATVAWVEAFEYGNRGAMDTNVVCLSQQTFKTGIHKIYLAHSSTDIRRMFPQPDQRQEYCRNIVGVWGVRRDDKNKPIYPLINEQYCESNICGWLGSGLAYVGNQDSGSKGMEFLKGGYPCKETAFEPARKDWFHVWSNILLILDLNSKYIIFHNLSWRPYYSMRIKLPSVYDEWHIYANFSTSKTQIRMTYDQLL